MSEKVPEAFMDFWWNFAGVGRRSPVRTEREWNGPFGQIWRAAQAAAYEECARIAEGLRLRYGFGTDPSDSYYNNEHECQDIACFCEDTREQIAAAIREKAKR